MLIVITPEKFVKSNTYSFKQIEKFCNESDFSLNELGGETIGRSFITIEDNNRDCAVSFILTSYNSMMGNLYECIYSDMK